MSGTATQPVDLTDEVEKEEVLVEGTVLPTNKRVKLVRAREDNPPSPSYSPTTLADPYLPGHTDSRVIQTAISYGNEHESINMLYTAHNLENYKKSFASVFDPRECNFIWVPMASYVAGGYPPLDGEATRHPLYARARSFCTLHMDGCAHSPFYKYVKTKRFTALTDHPLYKPPQPEGKA